MLASNPSRDSRPELIVDDEPRRVPSVASCYRGSGADQREAAPALGFNTAVSDR